MGCVVRGTPWEHRQDSPDPHQQDGGSSPCHRFTRHLRESCRACSWMPGCLRMVLARGDPRQTHFGFGLCPVLPGGPALSLGPS